MAGDDYKVVLEEMLSVLLDLKYALERFKKTLGGIAEEIIGLDPGEEALIGDFGDLLEELADDVKSELQKHE